MWGPNFRPISILPVISKIFETAALNQYFGDHSLISALQHAYRKSNGTVTCLFELLNDVYTLIDQIYKVALASLDVSKAFDSIYHEQLFLKN